MKAIARRILVIALVLGTLSSYAAKLVETNNKEERIVLNNVKKGQQLFIKNGRGEVLYEELITKNGSFSKKFDFSSLENGYYTLELDKDFHIQVTPFTIVLDKVIFYEKAATTIFKPVIRNTENKVMISKFSFEETSIKVTIYYKNEVIVKETVKGIDTLKRVYSLEKNKRGAYTVVINSNNRTYINEFTL